MALKKREIIERLQQEGLFETDKTRVVPPLPLCSGLITSACSAAYNDVTHTRCTLGSPIPIRRLSSGSGN